MVAMLFTAISYGRMARAYPSAGSAYTYVGQEINPALGYVTGWSMVMDYMLNPMICIIWMQPAGARVRTRCLVCRMGGHFRVDVYGPECSRREDFSSSEYGAGCGMGVVIAIFFVAAARYIFGHPHDGAAFFTRPFYDPRAWNTKAVLGGTSVAVLTYIGFDGISTLSEEAENPRRNILLATVLVCVVIGILSALSGVCGSADLAGLGTVSEHATRLLLSWQDVPGNRCSPSSDSRWWWRTSARAWARRWVRRACSMVWDAATLCRSRSLVRSIPNGTCLATTSVCGRACLSWRISASGAGRGNHRTMIWERTAQFRRADRLHGRLTQRRSSATICMNRRRSLGNLAPPVLGFVICFFLWISLSSKALVFGTIWMAVGIAVGAWKTKGFRGNLVDFELPPEE